MFIKISWLAADYKQSQPVSQLWSVNSAFSVKSSHLPVNCLSLMIIIFCKIDDNSAAEDDIKPSANNNEKMMINDATIMKETQTFH